MNHRRAWVKRRQTRSAHAIVRAMVVMAGCWLAILFCLSTVLVAQDTENAPANVLRHPGWNFAAEVSGGSTVVQVSAPVFVTANRQISNLALSLHAGRVLSHERGSNWLAGTGEWDVDVIPVQEFWVLGSHYTGGFETGPRWNFTHQKRRTVPFIALSGGMLFSPNKFPPGDTSRVNFSAALDTGAHLFRRPRRSFDVGFRLQHVSNAYTAPLNPGVPLSLGLVLSYSWY